MEQQHVIIAGGSGFLGQAIAQALLARGARVTIISRSGRRSTSTLNVEAVSWEADLAAVFDGTTAVINLAGENVGAGAWTPRRKREILESRRVATAAIVDAIRRCTNPPTLIQASAVGYYGNTTEPTTEATPAGASFLSVVCQQWERVAQEVNGRTRLVILRIGVVLDAHEGALPKLALPIRLFVGGILGTGLQWMPWVHRDDVVHAVLWAIDESDAVGVYNVCAPEPVQMTVFARTIAKVLRRPCLFRVPELVLRLILGERAAIVVEGQRLTPRRLLMQGFRFHYTDLSTALRSLFARP